MNNQQFRRLVLDTPVRGQDGSNGATKSGSPPTVALGSRMRSSIPMTPRSIKGPSSVDFARQFNDAHSASSQTQKKFRSVAAPKGTKLAAGYHDRTQDRVEDDADDRARRIKALEESMKLGQIDRETFEKLRDDITGGDIAATHLVKGLDRKLLERVRRGEDVLAGDGSRSEPQVDEEFDKLEEKEIAPIVKEKTVKKGEMAPPPLAAGTKRSRDAILAELKASRKAAAEAKAAAQPQLGAKFRRIGEKRESSRIERDSRGREVLIIEDEDGNIKRKVRKVKDGDKESEAKALPMPDKDVKPLGMEVPELPAQPSPKEEDEDIFEGVGKAYDPLGSAGEDSGSSSDGEEEGIRPNARSTSAGMVDERPEEKAADPVSQETSHSKTASTATDTGTSAPSSSKPAKRNYFNDNPIDEQTPAPINPLADPTILGALKKASTSEALKAASAAASTDEDEERLKKRAAMLAASDRDYEDMDLGFGSSRLADEEDMQEARVKLSQWKGNGMTYDDDDDGGGDGDGKKPKRKGKKRKGDKDSAADVLKVLERRKAGS